MVASRLLGPEEDARVVAAIREAERHTSGEIRVHVAPRCPGDPGEAARAWFAKLGMTRTALRNGVLLFFAEEDRKFSVVGDEGIHRAVGEAFWEEVRDALQEKLRRGRAADGIVEAIERIGRELGRSFPHASDDRNELSDDVSRG